MEVVLMLQADRDSFRDWLRVGNLSSQEGEGNAWEKTGWAEAQGRKHEAHSSPLLWVEDGQSQKQNPSGLGFLIQKGGKITQLPDDEISSYMEVLCSL